MMQIRVVCGDEECRREFPVSTEDPVWECPGCGRTIINRRYPFLTARLMQGTIDGDDADWRELFSFLVERAKKEFVSRGKPLPGFLNDAEASLSTQNDDNNSRWREMHDDLLEKAREAILSLGSEG